MRLEVNTIPDRVCALQECLIIRVEEIGVGTVATS